MTRSTVTHAKHKTVLNVTGKPQLREGEQRIWIFQALGCLLQINCAGARHNYAHFSCRRGSCVESILNNTLFQGNIGTGHRNAEASIGLCCVQVIL